MNVHARVELITPNIKRAHLIVVVTILSLNNARTKTKNELRCSSIFASSTPATTTNNDKGRKEEREKGRKGEKEGRGKWENEEKEKRENGRKVKLMILCLELGF